MSGRQRQSRGRKHHSDDAKDYNKKNSDVDESSHVVQIFREFQKELDMKNDRHERLVKLSRDITIESKRLIFLLHRISGSENKDDILQDAENKMKELHNTKFLPLAAELKGQDPFQFLKAYSPGLQEYIEAVTFYYFLKNQELVDVEKIQSDLTFDGVSTQTNSTEPATATEEKVEETSSSVSDGDKKFSVPIPLTEYMLGIADFTGELMRLAINSVAAGDLDTPREVTEFMRVIGNAFASFNNAPRELRRKATVLRQSLQKVENACYNLRVRGSEIPKHMLVDVFSSAQSSMPDESYIGETDDMT